ncbi:DUF2314 domain-containing protein [Pseudomonas sp. UBA6562]|uniref:DUF2314 domain-containing protein n=1 Tax=Pseudomonas sp. UBA6562 TaxID=1947332 RepID=UPI0025FACB6F|nr:DUF2314 domain-containing protein [Pseudomonas sp. UBA6562]
MSDRPIYSADGQSAAFQTAVSNAQATFRFFWRELSWEARRIIPALEVAAVKMSFPVDSDDPEAPSVENMWLSEVDFDGTSISGVLLNASEWITEYAESEWVTLPFSSLNDWMYVSQGEVCGGFTIDVLRSEMSDQERAEHDAAWGLDFGEPGTVRLVPAGEGQAEAVVSRGLDTPYDRQVLEALDAGDHPMAVNMQEKVEEGLRQYPSMITEADEAGWLLMHHQALAGNYLVVRSLLQHGADASARTDGGQTAAQLAQEAGWSRVARLLRGEA